MDPPLASDKRAAMAALAVGVHSPVAAVAAVPASPVAAAAAAAAALPDAACASPVSDELALFASYTPPSPIDLVGMGGADDGEQRRGDMFMDRSTDAFSRYDALMDDMPWVADMAAAARSTASLRRSHADELLPVVGADADAVPAYDAWSAAQAAAQPCAELADGLVRFALIDRARFAPVPLLVDTTRLYQGSALARGKKLRFSLASACDAAAAVTGVPLCSPSKPCVNQRERAVASWPVLAPCDRQLVAALELDVQLPGKRVVLTVCIAGYWPDISRDSSMLSYLFPYRWHSDQSETFDSLRDRLLAAAVHRGLLARADFPVGGVCAARQAATVSLQFYPAAAVAGADSVEVSANLCGLLGLTRSVSSHRYHKVSKAPRS